MTYLKHITLCAAAALMTACATSTPYQAANADGRGYGFNVQSIETDRARITFSGNSMTERDTVETYLLYRAAEAALEKGYDHFTLLERDTEAKTRVSISDPFYDPYFGYSAYGRGGWSPFIGGHRFYGRRGFGRRGFGRAGFGAWGGPSWGFGRGSFFNDYDVREITKYRAMAEVKFGRGAKPANEPSAYNAREVIENLRGEIQYPKVK